MASPKYLVFARKWRPQTFEDVIGQEHITRDAPERDCHGPYPARRFYLLDRAG